MFDINNYDVTIINLYNELVNELGQNKLLIDIDYSKSSGGTFYKLPDGDYSINISSNSQNDFVLSHELLHVQISIHHNIPSIVHFDNTKDNVCELVSMLFNSMLDHKYIFREQKRLGICGYNKYIDEYYKKIIEASSLLSSNINQNFMILISLITFINDTTDCCLSKLKEIYYKGIEESMPEMYEIAQNLMRFYIEREKDTPYYLRKTIIKMIDNLISIFEFDMSFLKYDISVRLSVRERQLTMPANMIIDLLICEGKSYFVTKFDKQSICNIRWNFPLTEIPKRRDMLANINLGRLLDMYNIDYYIDDRKGAWYLNSD